MQVKTIMRYHLTQVRMIIIKKPINNKGWQVNNKGWQGYGERELSYTVGENVNWCNHCGG